jgi:hypothetical protein
MKLVQTQPGCLEGLVNGFQQQALLGIDSVGFIGRDVEEGRVKGADIVVQEVRLAGIRRTWIAGVWMVEGVDVEAIGGDAGSNIARLSEQLPQARGRRGSAGEPTRRADNGHCRGFWSH